MDNSVEIYQEDSLTAKEDTKRKLTPMEEKFLEVLFSPEVNGNYRAAMRVAGYSDNTSSYALTTRLADEILEATKLYLVSSAPKAAHSYVDILDKPNQLGASNKLNAANQILDRGGLVKREIQEKRTETKHIIILPEKEKPRLVIDHDDTDT